MGVLYTILGILAFLIGIILVAVLVIKVRIVFEFSKTHGDKARNSIRITFFGEKVGFDLKDFSWKSKKNKEEKVEKDEKFFEKKVLTLVWVFGTIIKRATETRQRKEH